MQGHEFKNVCIKKVSFASPVNLDADAQATRNVETRNHRRKNNDEYNGNNGVCDVDDELGGGGEGVGGNPRHSVNDGKCRSSLNVKGL